MFHSIDLLCAELECLSQHTPSLSPYITEMATSTLSVAHYGHPLLKGARHWSLLLHLGEGCAIAYQLTGSTDVYEFKQPEEGEFMESQTYMGRVAVGSIDLARQEDLLKVLGNVPITRGDLQWNCQNWVVAALEALRNNGFNVDVHTRDDLAAKLEQAKRDG